jgi:hypothetical protein
LDGSKRPMKATRDSTGGRMADPMEALRDDIAVIRKDISSLVNRRVGAVGDAVLGTLHGAGESARHLAARSKQAAGAAHERLSEAAGSRPLTTIVVAAAAGIIGAKALGWMWRR